MNVLIISSSSKRIDDYYLSIAKSISSYLAKFELYYSEDNILTFDLIIGGSVSMMGICYNEFVKHNRKIYSYVTEKYKSDLEMMNESEGHICSDTFEMKKEMFNKSYLIVFLPGGTGTISELLSFVEEKRSNDKDKPIIVYNEDGFYDIFINVLNELEKNKFIDESVTNAFVVAKNKNEFVENIENAIYKRRVKKL